MLFIAFLAPSGARAQCDVSCNASLTTSDIPTGTITPFCNSNGFTVTAALDYTNGCDPIPADIFVIIETSIKLDGSRFRGDIITGIQRYYSNIQYAPAAGSPTLTATSTLSDFNRSAIIFRFRVTLPQPSPAFTDTAFFSLPFAFAPNFFFGDTPWRVWVSAREPDGDGLPQIPPMPPFNFSGKQVGTLLFDAPYFPIVGAQNVSTHYADLTGFWSDPNTDRTHSIMLLPDASGAPPVLTVDVPELVLGFFLNGVIPPQVGGDRGSLLMWPGAQVKVPNSGALAIGYVDMFTCKEQVSKGILVEQGARLVLENSTFTDAELAVHLKKGSTFLSFGAITFLNNYKGMRIDNFGSASVPDIVAIFGPFSVFSNTAALKLPYTGMPLPTTTKGYGLEILYHPGITLGSGTFGGLNNGVRLIRSSFTTRANFAGIKADAGASAPHHGHAIWGLGFGTETLDYSDGGIMPLGAFGSTDKGIFLQNMNASIDRVGITANAGIFLANCKLKTIAITNSSTPSRSFNCRDFGIRSSNCLPLAAGSKIDNNLIVMSNPGNTGPTGTGILLGEGSNATTPNSVGWIVTRNNLDLNGTHWGIRGTGVYNSEFRKNDIEILNNNNPDVRGLDVLNATNLLAYCNKVHAAIGESTAKGYRFTNVNQSGYTCNMTDKLSTGMEFSVLCEGTTLKGSELKNTPIGLLLRNDVTLGTQGLDQMNQVQDHGNRWVTSVAQHEAIDLGMVNLSRFGVDPQENAEFNPPNNWGDEWFVNEPTPTIPSFSCTGFMCLSPMVVYEKDRSVEKAVANGSIYSVGLPGVMPKVLENHLYAELQKSPAWAAGDPLYQQFLQSKVGTSTEAFWYIQQGIDALNNRTGAEQSSVAAAESNISNLRHELYLLDSTYASGTAINEAQYAQKLATLSAATGSLQTQLDNIRSNRLAQATQLLAQNTAIGTTQTWEPGEKQVNALEIQIFIQDSITTAQLAALDGLGSLCPNTNGEAVLRAQVLYNRFVEKEFSPVCGNLRGGAGDRTEENLEPSFIRLFPNPTTGWVTIPKHFAGERTIQVFDIAGRLTHQVSTSDIEIDLSDLENGVYFLRIKDAGTG
ncbi:MAG: T9SS type A sorting domain-containing protein, partial [Saprospiraceae bacterium]